MMNDHPLKVWYEEGLPFSCTGCGACCTGSPGYTWITDSEMQSAADFLHITKALFMRRYIRRVGQRFALIELKKQEYDCVFLQGKKCLIYPVRPKQCRTYPWWPENLSSPEQWESEMRRCEGMRCKEPQVSCDEIQKTLQEHLAPEE